MPGLFLVEESVVAESGRCDLECTGHVVIARLACGERACSDGTEHHERRSERVSPSTSARSEYERESPAFQCRYFLGTQKVSLG